MAVSTKWVWSLNNLTSPEFGVTRGYRAIACFAILAALLLHAVLIWLLFQHSAAMAPVARPIQVTLVREPKPPPPPKPVPAARHIAASAPPVAKPVPHAAPLPVIQAKPQIHVQQHSVTHKLTAQKTRQGPPVMHFGAAGAEAGLGLDLGAPSGGNGSAHGAIGDFDDAVKQRIMAAKTYPPALPGMWDQCIVYYRVTIDRNGQLLDYQLNGCGNPFLDAAARAAILLASPFPPPPDFGGNEYIVYGSLIFKH